MKRYGHGLDEWLAERGAKDDRLYEQYGKPLESDHRGEFVAISDAGEVIIGSNELQLFKKAIETFGSGRFALRKIGAVAEGRWRGL